MGHTELDEFLRYMQVADVAVNLRYPTSGETSGTLIRLLGLGKPVIVSNLGAFAEIPDGACAKVDLDEFEEDLLFEYLRRLAADEGLRRQMGENARRFVAPPHPGSFRPGLRRGRQERGGGAAGPVPAAFRRSPPIRPGTSSPISRPTSAPRPWTWGWGRRTTRSCATWRPHLVEVGAA